MPRRTVYYHSTKGQPKVQEHLVKPIKAMIEENPSFGYRTVVHLLGFNKNTVQRVFQLKGWQVRKRPVGFRPRIQVLPSVAKAPDVRWATDLCRVWTGRDGWASLALVIDCYSRELLGWHLSRSGRSKTAEAALEQALIARYGCLGKVKYPFLLRSDNGLVFTSRSYTALVKSYGLQQEFITPYSPEQNGMVERVIRTLKDQCVHRNRFETLQHASRVGAVSRQAGIATAALTVVRDQAVQAREAVAGVNLDEEAADLIRLQQAYQANARVMQAATTMFDTLLAIR